MKQLLIVIFSLTFLAACGSPIGNPTSGSPQTNNSSGNSDKKYFDEVTPLTGADASKLLSEFIPQGTGATDNRYSTALFGIAREMISIKETIPFTTVNVSTPYIKNGTLAVQIYKSSNEKAPLAIILNPLFGGEFQDQMLRFKEYYAGMDFHVMVFMNTWSPDIIKKSPSFFPGDIWTEGRMHLELIDQLVESEFGRENILGATLVGMSYGAFMSGVVKAYDQDRANPLIDGPTLLVNPPHDILHSLKTLDRQIDELKKIDGAKCLLGGGFVKVIQQAIKIADFNDAEMNESCAKYILTTVGFSITLKYSVAELNKSKELGLSLLEIANMTYEKYIQIVAHLNPPKTDSDLGYWMKKAQTNGYDRFLVVNSQDDSINEGNDLKNNLYFEFDATNLITLPTGGHTGFREAKSTNPACKNSWAQCLLNKIYRN